MWCHELLRCVPLLFRGSFVCSYVFISRINVSNLLIDYYENELLVFTSTKLKNYIGSPSTCSNSEAEYSHKKMFIKS